MLALQLEGPRFLEFWNIHFIWFIKIEINFLMPVYNT